MSRTACPGCGGPKPEHQKWCGRKCSARAADLARRGRERKHADRRRVHIDDALADRLDDYAKSSRMCSGCSRPILLVSRDAVVSELLEFALSAIEKQREEAIRVD